MEPVTLDTLQSFLQRLGERYPSAGILYLLGGSALRPPTPAGSRTTAAGRALWATGRVHL
ncbi:MAG: hypothetical protein WBW48_00085 [Anaerolineae bacterium]